MIFITLILDVLAYHSFNDMFSNRACEKTIRPEFAAPQLFLDFGAPFINATLNSFVNSRVQI